MENIETNRRKLDEIDEIIITKLLERFEITKEIGKYKKMHNIEIFQPDREKAIIDSIKLRLEGYEDIDAIIEIYKMIMNQSKALQIY